MSGNHKSLTSSKSDLQTRSARQFPAAENLHDLGEEQPLAQTVHVKRHSKLNPDDIDEQIRSFFAR
jgi:hypothetical protein